MGRSPRHLPKLRDQTVRHLADPTSPLRSRTGRDNQAGLDLAADHLRVAGPYRVDVDPEYRWYQDRDGDGVVCER